MHAAIRRYEGVDAARTEELSRKVGETLVPRLKTLEGFRGTTSSRRTTASSAPWAVQGPCAVRRGHEDRGCLGEGREARVGTSQPAQNHQRPSHRSKLTASPPPNRLVRRHRGRGSARRNLPPGRSGTGPPPAEIEPRVFAIDATARGEGHG